MNNRRKLYLIGILAVFAISLVLSQKADPSSAPFFYLKRAQEKAFLKLKASPKDKLEYMSFLLDNRLQELSGPIRAGNHNFVLPSSLRYSTLAGQITDLIIANNLKDEVDAIKTKFMDHKKALYDLYVLYPKNTEDTEYKYIEDDINYLKLYINKLSQIR